jgi:hypothetical protein
MEKEPESRTPAMEEKHPMNVRGLYFFLLVFSFLAFLAMAITSFLLFLGVAEHRVQSGCLPPVIVVFVAQRNVIIVIIYAAIVVIVVIVIPSVSAVYPSFVHFNHLGECVTPSEPISPDILKNTALGIR